MKFNKFLKSILVIILLVFISGCGISSQNESNSNTKLLEQVKIPKTEITQQVKFFSQNINGKNIKYFAIKDNNGNIKVAFDACDVCGGQKGYHQEGTDMVCNNCGRHFKIEQLGSQNLNGGGCWPSYLEHKEEDNNIIIYNSNIEKGAKFFT